MKKEKKILIIYITIALLSILYSNKVNPQPKSENYINLYNDKNYNKSIEIIEKKLKENYSKRIEYRIVSLDFITMKKVENDIDLKKIFRNRKIINTFIEDNNELYNLHIYAARCYFNLQKFNNSLNHYFQSFRFKEIEFNKDDIIFYEISKVFLKKGDFKAYLNTLETAFTLNSNKYEYSHELGIQLSKTNGKKKAIYHLERYIKLAEENIEPNIYLVIGNLYEDVGKYLETEKYYKKYLEIKPEEPNIIFALAYISFQRTGNHSEALELFQKSIKLLSEKDIYRKSKAYEFIGDISWKNLEFKPAIESYMETIKYQEKIFQQMKEVKNKINSLENKIKEIKSSLITKKDFDDYSNYEILLDDKGKVEQELNLITKEYNKLNPGKVRWFIADAFEKIENYEDAINYYRQAVSFNYNSNEAREKMIKLQLKIKRGY